MPRLGAEEPTDHARATYQRLEQTDDKAKRVIDRLEDIKIDEVSFENLTAAEAVGYLTQRVVGEKVGG